MSEGNLLKFTILPNLMVPCCGLSSLYVMYTFFKSLIIRVKSVQMALAFAALHLYCRGLNYNGLGLGLIFDI